MNRTIFQRQEEYNDYLNNHIDGVKNSYYYILKPIIEGELEYNEIIELDNIIENHDASKYGIEEYDAYLNYFYPENSKNRKDDDSKVDDDVQKDFDMAWNHHQKCNPHHWQYWVLLKDSGELIPMDMPFEYIVEMICDWHSFSARKPESTAYKWYNDMKDKMILSDNTRKLVEALIPNMKMSLKSLYDKFDLIV